MKAALYLAVVVAIATVSEGEISGTNPVWGACLCIAGSNVNVRRSQCGPIIGTSNWGECYLYTGDNRWCFLTSDGANHHYFGLNYFGGTGYVAGEYLYYGSGCGGGFGIVQWLPNRRLPHP